MLNSQRTPNKTSSLNVFVGKNIELRKNDIEDDETMMDK